MLNRLYSWYGKRVVRGVIGLIVVLIIAGAFLYKGSHSTSETTTEAVKLPEVTLSSVGSLVSTTDFSVVGTVRAVSEAELEAEAGGRVTAVQVSIGDRVQAGGIIATIENSQERAQLLQAEGAYESALVSSRASDISLDEAEVRVRNTYRDTYATADNVLNGAINQFYSNPGKSIDGFLLTRTGYAREYLDRRNAVDATLSEWLATLSSDAKNNDVPQMLSFAESTITEMNDLAISLYQIVTEPDNKSKLTDAEIVAYSATLSGARNTLDGALANISEARRSYDQAVLASTEGTFSQSSAQVKSALGVLRNAQANYEKTIVRSPITGVVNALYLTKGEYISLGQPAARIANNSALEVSTALGEKDLERVALGNTVQINNTVSGTITKIAPAVDPTTGKAEVKIGIAESSELKNGTTVSISFTQNTEKDTSGKIILPLATLKLLPSGPVVFGVDADNMLISYPVVLGTISGDAVEITEGLTLENIIVRDARGLIAGDKVQVAN